MLEKTVSIKNAGVKIAEIVVDMDKQVDMVMKVICESGTMLLPGICHEIKEEGNGEVHFYCEINATVGLKCDGCLQDDCDRAIPCEACPSRTTGEEIIVPVTGVISIERSVK